MSQRCEFIFGKPPAGWMFVGRTLGRSQLQLELPALAEARLEWALDGDLSEMEIFRQPSAPPADDRWCSNLAHHRINAWRNNQNRTQGL